MLGSLSPTLKQCDWGRVARTLPWVKVLYLRSTTASTLFFSFFLSTPDHMWHLTSKDTSQVNFLYVLALWTIVEHTFKRVTISLLQVPILTGNRGKRNRGNLVSCLFYFILSTQYLKSRLGKGACQMLKT